MDTLLQSITQLWEGLSAVFYLVYDYLFNLVDRLDAVTFTDDSLIYQFFGALRYIMGDVVYVMLMLSLTIGASFLLYKLFKKLFNFIISVIPGISGGSI